jgi:hypothetical protein
MMLPAEIAQEIRDSQTLLDDLVSCTEFGGRLAGSPSETRARLWLTRRLSRNAVVREHEFCYEGWRAQEARLERLDTIPSNIACHSLVSSPDAIDLEADVIDLGRGATDDFERAKAALRGRIAMVRHEYPFAQGTIHRRVKYARSRDEGCVAFIIANNLADGGLVTGSSGEGGPDEVPAIGIAHGGASLLSAAAGTRVRLNIQSERFVGRGFNLIAELPGATPEIVILCAHYDGHDLAESAMDNATGVAAVLRIFETLMPHAGKLRRTLRIILFTNEEWRLYGSRCYVDGLPEGERQQISMAISLDTLGGSPRLACLTGGFPELNALVSEAATSVRNEVQIVPRLLANSDHFNFARRGIPAMRLLVGFDDPSASTRYLLTEGDTRDKIAPGDFRAATHFAAEVVWRALTREEGMPCHKSDAEWPSSTERHHQN